MGSTGRTSFVCDGFEGEGQGDGEEAALAGAAFHVDEAIMTLDNFVGDVEAEAEADSGTRLRLDARYPVEALEDMREHGRRNANTQVANCDRTGLLFLRYGHSNG